MSQRLGAVRTVRCGAYPLGQASKQHVVEPSDVLGTGLPRRTEEDDQAGGIFAPLGSTLDLNRVKSHALTRNPNPRLEAGDWRPKGCKHTDLQYIGIGSPYRPALHPILQPAVSGLQPWPCISGSRRLFTAHFFSL